VWSRVAGVYDWQLAFERRPIRAMLSMVAVGERDRLLDVATGTGAVLRELGDTAPPPGRVVGVDASAEMVARARRAVGPDVELVRADAVALPFADASFDVATCAYLLHLLDRSARADVLRELARVLTPAGRLGVVTVAPPHGALSAALSWPVRAAARRSTGVLAGLRGLDPRDDLRAAGFEVDGARRVALGYPSLCVAARRPSSASTRSSRA
jgi:ubiquinone/menaquinone biosynthesis C-methylase UbiE